MSVAELPQGRFEGRVAFQQAVRDALATAAREGWRELVLSDPDFGDWPLGERAVAESLNAWASSGRRCILLARHYDEMPRRHARFVQWRQTWSHVVEAWGCRSADPLELPSAIWSPHWVMHRLDPVRCVGVAGVEPDRRLRLRELLDQWLGQGAPAFPATTLGL